MSKKRGFLKEKRQKTEQKTVRFLKRKKRARSRIKGGELLKNKKEDVKQRKRRRGL